MNVPKIDIRPDRNGRGFVSINGHDTGSIWMTDRGCCYQHTNRDFKLSSDTMEILVAIMRGIETICATDEDIQK